MAGATRGAHRLRRPAGGDHRARRAVPDAAREHRAADHGRAGHQHAGRHATPRRSATASTRSSPAAASAAACPSCWDGRAAERIAARPVRAGCAGRGAPEPRRAAPCQLRPITNALTIDVEDYFQVSAFAPLHRAATTGTRASAASSATSTASSSCSTARRRKATFFTLGWIAERYPQLVRAHRRRRPRTGQPRLRPPARERPEPRPSSATTSTRAKALLEDIGGAAGARLPRAELLDRHRQPVGASTRCATPATATARSIYPIRHDHYGMPDAPRFAHRRATTACSRCRSRRCGCCNRNLPSSGGGYFRLLPYALSRWMLQQVNQRRRRAGDLLFPPVGDRRRPAAHRRHRRARRAFATT